MSIARDYFRGQANILDSRYRSSAMKGNNSDTGFNREVVLKEWLSQHLPKSASPEIGGQIIDEHGTISAQVDIVLYNDNVPRFGGNPKSYYFSEGAIAAIQVKSVLTSKTLLESVDNLDSVKKCKVKPASGLTLGQPSDEILTGLFAFDTDYSTPDAVITALKKQEGLGKQHINFICVNKKYFIVHNNGEWHYTEEDGTKKPLDTGYIVADPSEECVFRMILTLSSEAKKNIATAFDFQPYFIDGWENK